MFAVSPCGRGLEYFPANRKRRWKVNPVVANETETYGYEPSATLITGRLHYKLQTHPLVREGATRRRAKQFSGKRREEEKSGHRLQRGADTKTYKQTDLRSQYQLKSTQLFALSESRGHFRNPKERVHPSLQAVTKQWLVKT
jgi:hypothetical protein